MTGFSAASIPFAILVGNHEITADSPVVVLNATAGTRLSYSGLRELVNPPQGGSITSASASEIPDWLSFDSETWEISGTPPQAAADALFSVTFEDAFSDTTNVTIQVHVSNSSLFRDSLPDIEVHRGSHFAFDLKPHLWEPSDVKAMMQTWPRESWIQFDGAALVLSGDVPSTLSDSSIIVSFQAASKSSGASQNQTLAVHVIPAAPSSALPVRPSQQRHRTPHLKRRTRPSRPVRWRRRLSTLFCWPFFSPFSFSA